MNAEMNLRKRAREDQHHRGDQADDRQLERRDQGDQFVHHVFKGKRGWRDRYGLSPNLSP